MSKKRKIGKLRIKRIRPDPDEGAIVITPEIMDGEKAVEAIGEVFGASCPVPTHQVAALQKFLNKNMLRLQATLQAVATKESERLYKLLAIGEELGEHVFNPDLISKAPLPFRVQVMNAYNKTVERTTNLMDKVVNTNVSINLMNKVPHTGDEGDYNGAEDLKPGKRGIIRDLFDRLEFAVRNGEG